MSVEVFNALPPEQLRGELLTCCASPVWAAAVADGRPYHDRTALLDTAQAAADALAWGDVLEALSAHPRIGERAAGSGQDAAWSRQEQSAAAGGDPDELIAVNRAYEERFGHVFLIFASGRSQAEIVAAARERLGNDDGTERVVVTGELRRIALLRLGRVLDAL